MVGKTFNVSELAALAACVPIAALLVALRERRRVAVLAALLTAAIVAQGIAPFELLPHAQGFSWMPFRSALRGSLELNYSALLEKCFWYFSLVWLLARCGWSSAPAALGTAGLVAVIEIGRMWLPRRSADVTDPLLAPHGRAPVCNVPPAHRAAGRTRRGALGERADRTTTTAWSALKETELRSTVNKSSELRGARGGAATARVPLIIDHRKKRPRISTIRQTRALFGLELATPRLS